MARRTKRPRLSAAAAVAARPGTREFTLWDGALSGFGLRVQPSGSKSFLVQPPRAWPDAQVHARTVPRHGHRRGAEGGRRRPRAHLGRRGCGPDAEAQGSAVPGLRRALPGTAHGRLEAVHAKGFDIYLRRRLLPAFGRLKLDTIDHVRVSAWFDAASVDRPGAANRAFEMLRALLRMARQWGELGEHVPDACANIVRNPRKAVARYLGEDELARLGAALDGQADEHPWSVAALRLLTLTGARLSEMLNLRWDEIDALSEGGGSARIEDSKTGPRTIWLGPEAVRVIASLPRADGAARVFHDDLTTGRLYRFWCGVRAEAGLPGLRIHDCRHTYASQGIMNGVGLPTVGKLLGHRRLATTAIYAHLDDAALHAAAEKAAGRVAKAMRFTE